MSKPNSEKSNFELLTDIRSNLAAFPNSKLIHDVQYMVEELYKRALKDKTIESHASCRRGIKPSKENCFACPYEPHCAEVFKD